MQRARSGRRTMVAVLLVAVGAGGAFWLATRGGLDPVARDGAPPTEGDRPGGSPRRRAAPGSPDAAGQPPRESASLPDPAVPPPPPGAPRDPGAVIELEVRDLATGGPASGLSFSVLCSPTGEIEGPRADGDFEVPASCDGAGVLRVPADGVKRLSPADPAWRVVPRNAGEARASSVLWVYRMVTVRARVVAGKGAGRVLDPASVRLSLVAVGQASGSVQAEALPPWSETWLEAHDVAEAGTFSTIDPSGRFTATVPFTRGVVMHAQAAGWRPAHVDLALAIPAGARDEVVLTLLPGRRVAGRVTGPDGLPVAGAQVSAYVIVRSRIGDVELSRLRLEGQAVKTRIDHGTGEATRVYVMDAACASAGEGAGTFALDLLVDGETVLMVWPSDPALLPTRIELGPETAADPGGLDVRLTAASGAASLRVLADGLAVPGAQLSIADLTDTPAQPTFSWTLDAQSEMPVHLLTQGREYLVYVHRSRERGGPVSTPIHGHVAWEGQREVNVGAELRAAGRPPR